MTFNSVVADFQTILNRSDCTQDQANAFVLQSLSRAQRTLRLPSMQRQSIVTTNGPVTWVSLPADIIEMIDVIVQGPDGCPRPLRHLPFRKLILMSPLDCPAAYATLQGQIQIRGQVAAGWTITTAYYGQFSNFASGDSDNEITASNPDLIVYGALSFAGDTFQHPAASTWEQRYQQILAEVQGLGADLEWTGGPLEVQPMYPDWSACNE